MMAEINWTCQKCGSEECSCWDDVELPRDKHEMFYCYCSECGEEVGNTFNNSRIDLISIPDDNAIGMNFKEWCELDEFDDRKIIYEDTPCGSFNSEDIISLEQIQIIRKSVINKVELTNNEWHLWLVA